MNKTLDKEWYPCAKIRQSLGKDEIKVGMLSNENPHLSFPQLTTSASNHSTIHIHNSEYQILELVDWLHSVNTDNWLWISLFCVNCRSNCPFPSPPLPWVPKTFHFGAYDYWSYTAAIVLWIQKSFWIIV